MGSPENPYKVRLDVSNFGPIAEASVELRPLTVFVGPSNTGKTYLATLTYALHRFFTGASSVPAIRLSAPFEYGSNRLMYGDPRGEEHYSEHELNLMSDWIKDVRAVPGSLRASQLLPKEVATVVQRQLRPHDDWGELLSGELARCFGVNSASRLNSYGSDSHANVAIECQPCNEDTAISALKFSFSLPLDGPKAALAVSDSDRLRISNEFVHSQARRFGLLRYLVVQSEVARNPAMLTSISEDVAAGVAATMVRPLSSPAYFLPADRTGTMNAHRAIVELIAAAAPYAGLGSGISLPSLSGVYSDFLFQLYRMASSEPQSKSDPHSDLGTNIELKLLSGKIQTDRSNPSHPVFLYMPFGWQRELPLMNASSMVSELAPVVLYLRHVVKPGEVLIIEEPESNLHPSMQVELVRQLAAVVKSGVRIIITTHSEWILDELANLVRLSELPPERRSPRLEDEPALDPSDVGVWLFERGEGDDGSHVKELPLDLNQGGFKSGYEDTARLSYNQWVAIHNLIQGSTTT